MSAATTDPADQHPDLTADPGLGDEISITGRWVPTTPGGRFRTSPDGAAMLREWEDIHRSARESVGVLSTEINHAVGEEAVLVHHVFADAEALRDYFSSTAAAHVAALTRVARPQLHMVRGAHVPEEAVAAVRATGVDAAIGEHAFGFVKHDHRMPDPATAVNVTAKWTATPGVPDAMDQLVHWWQEVATTAYDLEPGMVRFEAHRVRGEDALLIHEVFEDTSELKFHLTKGTAARFKDEIDRVAAPDQYYFRGPVSWTIRTYSRFMHLPATYSSRGSHHTAPGGSRSDGLTTDA